LNSTKQQQMYVARHLIQNLWKNYSALVPEVSKIEKTIKNFGEIWSEDHIAFRTLPGKFLSSALICEALQCLGYTKRENLKFEEKKLNAFWMAPPLDFSFLGEPFSSPAHSSQILPKIFISELALNVDESFENKPNFSSQFLNIVENYASKTANFKEKNWFLNLSKLGKEELKQSQIQECCEQLTNLFSCLPWPIPSFQEYEILRKESEYAAWTLAFGNVPNHFTVSVHLMKKFKSLKNFHEYIFSELKIPMNSSGGIVKGSEKFKLEQCATLAALQEVQFTDGAKKIPYAFVEFAFRFPLGEKTSDGVWESYYQGFVVSNADKIFDSTNFRK
jgi:Domain of unknown function (DUF1338)